MKEIHFNTRKHSSGNESPNEQSSNINASRAFLLFIVYLIIYICIRFILETGLSLLFYFEIFKLHKLIMPSWMAYFFSFFSMAISQTIAFFILFSLTKKYFSGDRLNKKDIFSVGWSRGTIGQILIYAFFGIVIYALLLVRTFIFFPTQNIFDAMIKDIHDKSWIKNKIAAVTIIPFVEEFMFRGVLLAGFAKSWGKKWALVLSNFLFILIHIEIIINSWPSIITYLILTIFFTISRIRTGSLGPAIAAHFFYNLFTLIVPVAIVRYIAV